MPLLVGGGSTTSVSGQPGQGERRESATDVRLNGDEMAADADDGDARPPFENVHDARVQVAAWSTIRTSRSLEVDCGLATLRRPFPLHGGTEGALLRHSRRYPTARRQGLWRELARVPRDMRLRRGMGLGSETGNRRDRGEIRNDPILQPLLDEWRSGNDSAYQRFLQHVLDWTEDEYDPN